MIFDASAIARTFGLAANDNIRSTAVGLALRGDDAGLERPHRLSQYIAQLAHESARWRYDREIWGPTAAQRGYEGRTDLGNTQPGDGSKFRGRGPIQITGRDNYRQFTAWVRRHIDSDAPDFEADPERVNADPWEGLGPIWYWETRNLNRYADRGDVEMVTRRINGGLNGYEDRLRLYDEAALHMLDYPSVRAFQVSAGIAVDGISGPETRGAMHKAMMGLRDYAFGEGQSSPGPSDDTMAGVKQSLATICGLASAAITDIEKG